MDAASTLPLFLSPARLFDDDGAAMDCLELWRPCRDWNNDRARCFVRRAPPPPAQQIRPDGLPPHGEERRTAFTQPADAWLHCDSSRTKRPDRALPSQSTGATP